MKQSLDSVTDRRVQDGIFDMDSPSFYTLVTSFSPVPTPFLLGESSMELGDGNQLKHQ